MRETRPLFAGDLNDESDHSPRPRSLASFIGQRTVCENLAIGIQAARERGGALDHVLFHGPPGLGKTTLARIVANELGVGFRQTSGPIIARAGDLAAQLTNLDDRDVLFIDEIHRLNPAIEEILYPAMEEFQLDLMIGEGPAAKSIRIDLNKFTLVGATTRTGLLTKPLLDRFLIPLRLDFYEPSDIAVMVMRLARINGVEISGEGALEIARRSRGTPRVAVRLLHRVSDIALVERIDVIDARAADSALQRLEVDGLGLDMMDRRYLSCVLLNYDGGPVGVETIAAALSEHRDFLEDVIEPFLMQEGMIKRTPSGRVVTPQGYRHLGKDVPGRHLAQTDLFETDANAVSDNNG